MPNYKQIFLTFSICLPIIILLLQRNEPNPNTNQNLARCNTNCCKNSKNSINDNCNNAVMPSRQHGVSNQGQSRVNNRGQHGVNSRGQNGANSRGQHAVSSRSVGTNTDTVSEGIATLPSGELAAFEEASLKAHNKYRAMHGCPPLKLNRKLSLLASDWAQTLAKRNKMEHRPNNDDYGENIYYSEGLAVNAEAAVKMWYDEITLYNYAAGKFILEAGHFTQLIWRDTKELGIGIATRGNKVWVVANYDPPGNYEGEFKENVPRKRA